MLNLTFMHLQCIQALHVLDVCSGIVSLGASYSHRVLLTLPTSLGSDGRLVHLVWFFVCLFVCYQNQNYALVVFCRKHTGCARECCNCSCKLPGPRPTEDQPVAIAGHSFPENNQITNQLFNKPIPTKKKTNQPTGKLTN